MNRRKAAEGGQSFGAGLVLNTIVYSILYLTALCVLSVTFLVDLYTGSVSSAATISYGKRRYGLTSDRIF
jgi:hypothetical protein